MTTAQQIIDLAANGERQRDHLLNCLARHINSLSRTKQAEFGLLLKKHHDKLFIEDIKKRMKAMS